MRKLAFGAITFGLLAALAACGGGDGPTLVDSGVDGPPTLACNPVEQTGCGNGEKCTWINIDSATDLGTVGCVPNGNVARDGACTYGADGETTGFDDCVAGNICISGACEPICTISPDSCDSTSSCSRYTGLFTNATPELGACDYLCDPVTQERLSNPTQASCGGTGTDINATKGCYGVFDGDFSCAGVPQTVATNPGNYTQSDTAYGPMAGSAYLNGCAPGFAPLLRNANNMTAPVVCFAFCEPAPTCNTAGGSATVCGVDNYGGATGHTCADRGADNNGCQYFWSFETFDAATDPPHPDGVGYCWDSVAYVADWDGTNGPMTEGPWPHCDGVAPPGGGDDTTGDAEFWGCVPYPVGAAQGTKKHAIPPFHLATPADMAKGYWH